MEQSGGQMTFWDHLAALRVVLLRMGAVLVVLAAACFFVMPRVFDRIILWPCSSGFPTYRLLSFVNGDGQLLPDMSAGGADIKLINIKLGTQLMTHMSASLWMAVALSFPVLVYMLWGFVSPGLYEHERRGAVRAFMFGNVMFYLGVAVGYFAVFPMALRFLNDYSLSTAISNSLTLDSYMDNFYGIIIAMGAVFELPLVAWMLGRMGILKRSFFSRYRRYAIFATALLAAMITPTADLFTMAVVFVPVYSLWEFSALLVPRDAAGA